MHYLGADTIKARYGRKLPKTIFAGSVTDTNSLSRTLRRIVLKSQGDGLLALVGDLTLSYDKHE